MGREKKWNKMSEQKIYATDQEWQYARKIMQDNLSKEILPPFKITKDNLNLKHSFIVALDENGNPILGVIAQNHGEEGILGHGDFGYCKLVLWADGILNAVKIDKEFPDQYIVELMEKLGLIRTQFAREWQQRVSDNRLKGKYTSNEWIKDSTIQSKHYRILPLASGVNLKNFLSSMNNLLSMEQRRLIAISLLKAVAKLHQKGIVHNDLHAQNIMVDQNLNVTLIDFDKLADLNNLPTHFSEVQNHFGRRDIIAPELIDFRNKLVEAKNDLGEHISKVNFKIPLSFASDVYSLGKIFEKLFDPMMEEDITSNMINNMQSNNIPSRPTIANLLNILESEEFIEKVSNYDANLSASELSQNTILSNDDINELYPDEIRSSSDINSTKIKPK